MKKGMKFGRKILFISKGMKKKEIEFGRKILFIQPGSEKKTMEFGRKTLFKNLTKSTYFLCFQS